MVRKESMIYFTLSELWCTAISIVLLTKTVMEKFPDLMNFDSAVNTLQKLNSLG